MRYFFLIFIFLFACNCNNSKSEIYQNSELALLMREMYDNQLTYKEFIEQEKLITDFPEEYKKMHTATPTDKNLRTVDFQAMSTAYLNTFQSFIDSKNTEEQKKNYQTMIQMCISCHQNYCPGPIKKIKKLELN